MTIPKTQKEWSFTRLKNVAEINARSLSATTPIDFILRYLEISNVDCYGIISKADIREIPFMDAPSRARRIVQSGDTVISSVRPNLQAIAHINHTSGNFIASTGFYVVSPDHFQLEKKYTYYLLISENTKQYLEAVAKGVGYPAVDDKDFVTIKFSLPTFDEQLRIAEYLDEICSAIDATIKTKHKQLKTLDALRKSIIHEAVTRGLDDSVELKDSGVEFCRLVPNHWKRTKLRYEISVRNGDFVSNKLNDDGEYPVIGGNGFMGRTDAFNVDKVVVVLGRVGAYCGNVHHVSQRSWVSDNALIVESIHNKKFLTYLFMDLDFNSVANKTAQPVITGTKIKNTYVVLPPIHEQAQIADYITAENANLTALKDNLNGQISTLKQYRKSLIHECVTGKRRITKNNLKQTGVKLN